MSPRILLLWIGAVSLFAQTPDSAPPRSAKGLFLADASVGTDVLVAPDKKAARPATTRPGGQAKPALTPEGEYAGVMYWVELKTEAGQLLRVNSSRVFHSGERIRLHVVSNIEGDLTIMQSQNGSAFSKLYPLRSGMSGRVEKRKEVALPWFRFDQNPGDVRLILAVQGKTGSGTGTSPSQTARTTPVATAKLSAEEDRLLEQRMRAQLDAQKGSKSLIVEEDETQTEAGTYVVAPVTNAGSGEGFLAVEIRLQHR